MTLINDLVRSLEVVQHHVHDHHLAVDIVRIAEVSIVHDHRADRDIIHRIIERVDRNVTRRAVQDIALRATDHTRNIEVEVTDDHAPTVLR